MQKAASKTEPVDQRVRTMAQMSEAERDQIALEWWRRQNAKRIDSAVKQLRPESRNDVEAAMIEADLYIGKLISGFEPTKLEKTAVKKLIPALRRVKGLMKDNNLPTEIKLHVNLYEALRRCEKIAAAPPAKNPRKKAELKRLVVRKAAALMSKHGAPSSILVKLATILYGDPKANLTSQVAAFVREARRS